MKILFICKHNRFRSKVAEGIFNKLNKNKEIKVDSVGLVLDKERPYICENVLNIMKKKAYKITGKSKLIVKNKIKDYDLIVIVANNVDKNFFKDCKGEVIKWDVEDADENDYEKIKGIIEGIESRVKRLIGRIK